jgi:hypothetical protein
VPRETSAPAPRSEGEGQRKIDADTVRPPPSREAPAGEALPRLRAALSPVPSPAVPSEPPKEP